MPLFQEDGFTALPGQVLPYFIGREAQYRRQPAHQSLGDMIHGGLGRTPRQAAPLQGIHAILDDIKVETSQGHDTVMMQLLVNQVELELTVGPDDLFL